MKIIELKRKRVYNTHKEKWFENSLFRLLFIFFIVLVILLILLYYLLPGILILLGT